jgi:aldehyde dehydrogenase (NAD+)/betaine-aldehyde dehydrogenase
MTTTSTHQLGATARSLIDGPTNWIDGSWEDGQGSGVLTAVNPSTAEAIRDLPVASVEQAERAVAAARRAFDSGPWGSVTPRERCDLLLGLADLMERNFDDLVEVVVTEVGSPITLSRAMQVGMPIANVRWAASMALKGPQGGYEQALVPHLGPPPSSSMLQRVPAGVVAGITGYNFPMNSVIWKLAPGLAAGCTLVFKPSPRTPLSTMAMMRLVEQAGFPPGVVNFVAGDADVGETLSSHPSVDMVMFTGSLNVGRAIMRAGAETTKRLVLELGGKSATIVMPGADIEALAGPSILRWVRNSGQGCGATTRTLVPRADYDQYAAAAHGFIGDLKIGSPWDEDTDLGPLIRAEQRDFVEGHLSAALDQGAELVGGGGRPEGLAGYYMNAALVGNVTNADTICREELFGPVGALLPYDDVEDALSIAHDSPYGLHAAVYGPPAEAFQLARRLRTGAVSVNGGGFMHPEGPWGGFGLSGFGREMGEDGFREFFQVKHIQWPMR